MSNILITTSITFSSCLNQIFTILKRVELNERTGIPARK